jgi:membrane protein implicated in regulation of membrane protease activity
MRYSLLTLFGVMTAVAVLLGMPSFVYLFLGVFALSLLALAAFVWFAEATVESAADFLQLFASRRRLEDYDNPPFGIDPPTNTVRRSEKRVGRRPASAG